MDEVAEKYFCQIQDAIASDQLVLPTLPEVALKVREKIEGEDSNFDDIADMLAQDAALSANFIRIANSPIYRGVEEIVDLRTVINRMGLKVVRDLVVSLALKQIFMATSAALDKQFRGAWATSVGVASISRMLAVMARDLSAEQALLAGLIHNIGVLPVLVMLEKETAGFEDDAELQYILRQLQGPVGKLVLESWEFPEHLLDVAVECYNFQRQHDGDKDYVDVIQVSLIQGGFVNLRSGEWRIQAFEKLNLDPDVNVVDIDENKEVVEQTKKSLMN